MYLVSTARKPLQDMRKEQIFKAAQGGWLPTPLWPASAGLGNEFRELACRCCSKVPGSRPHAGEIHSQLSLFSGKVDLQQSVGQPRLVSGSSSNGGFSQQAPVVQEELHCWVACGCLGAPIVDSTIGFMQCCGLASDEAPLFLDGVSDPKAFQYWTNRCVNNAQSVSNTAAPSGLHIVLRLPSLVASGMELHAQCTCDIDHACESRGNRFQIPLASHEVEEDPFIVHVVLHHVRLQRLPPPPIIGGIVDVCDAKLSL